LGARGYGRLPDVLVQTADLGAAVAAEDPPGVEVEGRATPLVMNGVCDPRWGSGDRRARAELFGRIRKPHLFAVATEGGEPASGGLCVADGALAGIFALRTQAPLRGRGHARAVVRRLASWARRQGAATLYFQVEEDNAPARGVFNSFGAETAYRYWYRERA
jgi:GNAT superfamily N-acetyltransferase